MPLNREFRDAHPSRAPSSPSAFPARRSRQVLMCLLLAWMATSLHATPPADIVLRGVISGTQRTGYVLVPFTVPAGTSRISISLTTTGSEERSTIDLGLLDPDRFRGWSGGKRGEVTVSTADATPSYLSGPLPAGAWKLILGVAFIRPGNSVSYTATVHLTPATATEPDSFTPHPLASGARWYRGDLHLHTAQSDGTCPSQSGIVVPCPVFLSVQQAAQHGLDFLAITDHNTTSTYNEERELQPYFDKLLLIPGREITTYAGHLNIWGTTQFVDFRAGASNPASRNAVLATAQALGALTSINHPVGPDAERCIGCNWDASDSDPNTDMRLVSAIEVINGPSSSPSAIFHESDIHFWEAQLARGFHITAVGGSDTHRPDLDTIGIPTTAVFAQNLSVKEILLGLRAGHVFIDLTGSRNLPPEHLRLITLTATSGSHHAGMGDTLTPSPAVPLTIAATVANCAGSELRFFVDGSPDPSLAATTLERADQTLSLTWQPKLSPGKPHWLRAEVRGPDGALQLLSNPIYLTPESH